MKAILISDRWVAYQHWATEQRQLCWAHLLREFTALTERGGEAARPGRAFLSDAKTMFASGIGSAMARSHAVSFGWRCVHCGGAVDGRLQRGAELAEAKTAGTCRDLLNLAPALWTFIDLPGVEPTNNAAERAIRQAVLWRKASLGSHSSAGSRFAERMLTVAATLKQQDRNIVDYITAACVASMHGKSAPSLLPTQLSAA